MLLYSVLAFPWRLSHLLLSLDYFETRPLILILATFFSTQPRTNSSNISFFLTFSDYSTTLKIDINNKEEEKQFRTANYERTTAYRGYKAVFKNGAETTAIMAIYLRKQERFSGFTHCAVIFRRIAVGPKWH